MGILSILYWLILILSLIGVFAPTTWPYGTRISLGSCAMLFVIIGLRVFRIPIA